MTREGETRVQLSPLELGKTAYAAYGETTDFKNFRGEPMPAWDDLGSAIQTAWVMAAGAVYRAIVTRPRMEGS
ncbi:hypothetical protein AB0M87_04355 [Streptomyces sp. NPDC051320]|uniref:hypothetical protein n=1 Tax=Streptomyces sp. NPDC051320 TaxID=3154644 RepID=UPI0034121A97